MSWETLARFCEGFSTAPGTGSLQIAYTLLLVSTGDCAMQGSTRTDKECAELPGSASNSEHSAPLTQPFSSDPPRRRVKDRGRAKYFHGREEVLGIVAELRADAEQGAAGDQGTTFLIQGAPGAGKTALLYRCAGEAARDGWIVAKIDSRALHDPIRMSECLDKPYIIQSERSVGATPWVASVSRTKTEAGISSVSRLLEVAAQEMKGLMLVLDEVQNIRDYANHSHKPEVKDTLNLIHNGEVGRPVILLAGGLGTSQKAFGRLGISRFHDGCIVNLGRLPASAERAVIQDWLVKDGGAEGDATPWIDAIARETHGWPQHIMCFVQPAVHIVHSNHGQMTPDGLEAVLRQGQQRKENYYLARVEDLEEQDRMVLGRALSTRPADASFRGSEVRGIFSGEYSRAEAERIFELIVHKGVLARTREGRFAVPIPSMHHWLVYQYRRARTQQQDAGL